jgi:hypothetical protein
MILGTAKRNKEGAKPLPTRHFSKKQEEAVAKATGGKRTPNSGATDFGGKSDVDIANLFNIECKTKTSNSESISIKKEWIHKNKREALFDGNPYSAIAFNFGPDSENYYIIDEYLFLELIDHLKTLDEPL